MAMLRLTQQIKPLLPNSFTSSITQIARGTPNAYRQIRLNDPHLSAKPRQWSKTHWLPQNVRLVWSQMCLASLRELLKSDNRTHPEMACGPERQGWGKASQEAAWDSWSRMTVQNGRDGVSPEGTTGWQWRKDSSSPFCQSWVPHTLTWRNQWLPN